MGSKSSSSGSLLPSHMLQQQSAGQLQKLALIGFISLLLTVNLLYQVKTHARMQQLSAGSAAGCHQQGQFPGSTSKQLAAGAGSLDTQQDAASEAAERKAVDYLVNNVLTSRPQRHVVENAILPKLKATNKTVAEYRTKVSNYLSSSEFKQRWDALKAQTTNERGIVISAGGKYYLPQALVLLRILRHNLNCTLPVEIFWVDSSEMDDTTLKALKKDFAPLEGYDASKLPYPSHHLPGATLRGFPMKPWALLNSRFKEVLLLDCDVVPMRDPSYMFDAPEFRQNGNCFWGDIYGEGMFKDEAFDYVGVDRRARAELDAGKADFNRYAESGQVMINRAMHLDMLEWTWFLNSFSKGHLYEFMYGDKDTYGVAFALANKAHMYTHVNMPPGGIFTHRDALGWQPGKDQMNKQGNWWLHALVHYDHHGEVLHMHRVTGEISVNRGTPKDELITPPIPHSWSMWWMGYGSGQELQRTLDVVNLNVSFFLETAEPGQLCPMAAWSAYWTMRTHAIPIARNLTLEAACSGALDAQYGRAAASIVRSRLMEHPARLTINALWDSKVDGGWKKPKHPLLAVPLNMTAGYSMWQNMDAALQWAKTWVKDKPTLAKR